MLSTEHLGGFWSCFLSQQVDIYLGPRRKIAAMAGNAEGMSALEQYEIWCSALKEAQVSKYLQRHDQDCLPSTVSIQLLSLPS